MILLLSKPNCYIMYHQIWRLKILHFAHAVWLCVLFGYQNKAIRSPYSIDWPDFYNREGVCLLRGTDWIFIYNSKFCPHSAFMCFVWISEQTAITSLYNINWLVFVTETECVYCAARTGSFYIILRSAPHSVFMCFVWIWEQTTIISLYSINWLVCITECLLCGTDWVNKFRLFSC